MTPYERTYEDILNRHPRYDSDFTFKDHTTVNWPEPREASSWVNTVLVLLWVAGVVALIIYTCAQSPKCMWYACLSKLRYNQYQPQTRTEYGEDWTNHHAIEGDEVAHHSLIPPSAPPMLAPQGRKRLEDLPPAYSEVMKAELPAYQTVHPQCNISVIIPDREWTNRTQADSRENVV